MYLVKPPVFIRKVWKNNLNSELELIRQSIFHYPIVSIDTEYPGTIYHLPEYIPKYLYSSLKPPVLYSTMKKNVEELPIIQLGLTLSDCNGNLPSSCTPFSYIWEFNFRDFDPDVHQYDPESITLLEGQGINFSYNKENGIDSKEFAYKFKAILFDMKTVRFGELPPMIFTWITFHGSHDFGYLIRILTGKDLPEKFEDFMWLVQAYFGETVYDVKVMSPCLKLKGGLERVAKDLGLNRIVGKSHQAGSDSLLTIQVFLELKNKYLSGFNLDCFRSRIYGLTN